MKGFYKDITILWVIFFCLLFLAFPSHSYYSPPYSQSYYSSPPFSNYGYGTYSPPYGAAYGGFNLNQVVYDDGAYLYNVGPYQVSPPPWQPYYGGYYPGYGPQSPYFQTQYPGYYQPQYYSYPYYNQPNYYQSSYYQPGGWYNSPYSSPVNYPYWGGYSQPFSNSWYDPWQQPYQSYWGPSYPSGGYSWNPYAYQFPNYSSGVWYDPWQSWSSPTEPVCTGMYGKPAIYLYPQQDTYVSVELDIDGVITRTIPLYQDGWYVLARADGTIIDESQGEQSYDYLFWEAETNLNEIELPDEGWVVAQEDLEDWFGEYLPRLGLNEKEKEQFMEYWLEKLQGKDYYEMKLLSFNFLEEHAKLTISPSPDTLIRVIFYFTPLDEYKILESPVIETPEREGFVVLEWGGVLSE